MSARLSETIFTFDMDDAERSILELDSVFCSPFEKLWLAVVAEPELELESELTPLASRERITVASDEFDVKEAKLTGAVVRIDTEDACDRLSSTVLVDSIDANESFSPLPNSIGGVVEFESLFSYFVGIIGQNLLGEL